MANITVLITSSPFGNNIHALAQRYINAAVVHHTIDRIFFYQDAVLVANQAQQPPQGQVSILSHWKSLAERNNIPLQACIANSLRRGLTDNAEQARYDLPFASLDPAFELCGLGDMAMAHKDSDKVVQF
jgi:tRNA 2-thiouridine synthesizing protein D